MGSEPALRYVTGTLHVEYLKPTPLDALLTVRAEVASIRGRVTTITSRLYAGDTLTARGEAVCIKVPENWGESDAG